jgi:hypothetical protein
MECKIFYSGLNVNAHLLALHDEHHWLQEAPPQLHWGAPPQIDVASSCSASLIITNINALLGLQVLLAYRSTVPVELTSQVLFKLILHPACMVVEQFIDPEDALYTCTSLNDSHVY